LQVSKPLQLRIGAHVLILSLATLTLLNINPYTVSLYTGLLKSPDSFSYNVNLKFMKLAVGLAVILFARRVFQWRRPQVRPARVVSVIVMTTLLCAGCLLGFASLTHLVRVDVKVPPAALAWLFNNLVLVCFGEEAFFRGYLQDGLIHLTRKPTLSLWITSVVFGATHFVGGILYIMAATLAGLCYGWAYQRGGLKASVPTHFLINAIHFFCFSYPMLAHGR
jgi:membrane protease YdiL (CAAX protease family)